MHYRVLGLQGKEKTDYYLFSLVKKSGDGKVAVKLCDYLKDYDLNGKQWYELLKILLFRHKMGISDTNHRNILVGRNQLYSVDEMTRKEDAGNKQGWDRLYAQRCSGEFLSSLSAWVKKRDPRYFVDLWVKDMLNELGL